MPPPPVSSRPAIACANLRRPAPAGSVARGIRELIEGGIGGFALEKIGEGFSKAADAMTKYREALEHTNDASTRAKATGDLVQNLIESIPGVGGFVKGIREAGNAFDDLRAAQLKAAGASEEEVDAARSVEGLLKHEQEESEALTKILERQIRVRRDLLAEQDRAIGVSEQKRLLDEEDAKYEEKRNELMREHIKLGNIPNADRTERRQLRDNEQAQFDLREQHRLRTKNINEHAAAEEHELQNAHNERLEADDAAHDLRMQNLRAQASADHLQAMHKSFEAEQVLRDNQFDEEKRRVELKLNEDLLRIKDAAEKRKEEGKAPLNDDAEKQRAYRHAQEEQDAIAARKREADQRAQNEHQNRVQDEREQRHNSVMEVGISILEKEGELGSRRAKQAAAILEIHEQWNQKREEFNKLLREGQDLTADERKQIEAARDATVGAEQAEVRAAGRPQIGPQTSPFSQSSDLKFGQDASRESFAAGARQREQDERNRPPSAELDAGIETNKWLSQLLQIAKQQLDEAKRNHSAPAHLAG